MIGEDDRIIIGSSDEEALIVNMIALDEPSLELSEGSYLRSTDEYFD